MFIYSTGLFIQGFFFQTDKALAEQDELVLEMVLISSLFFGIAIRKQTDDPRPKEMMVHGLLNLT